MQPGYIEEHGGGDEGGGGGEGGLGGGVGGAVAISSMGGGVAAELVASRFPHLACVNDRSFSSLSHVSASTLADMVGLQQGGGHGVRPLMCGGVRLALALAFSHLPWRPPLETASHWRRLRAGSKLLIFHPADGVIGHAAALHTALEARGQLDGTDVVCLGGTPRDAHNEPAADFAPQEWAAAVAWIRSTLLL